MNGHFLPGLDVLAGSRRNWIKGKRIGLVSHPAAISSQGAPATEVLLKANAKITALFGPEHGFFGTETAGHPVKSNVHPQLKIPVYSLYGSTRKPAPEMLDKVDALVFDLQDLGVRTYTYVSTLRNILDAAAQSGKEVIVADRPIPLPRIIDGPMLDPKFASFVAGIPAPMCYGMTPGEISLLLKHDLNLEVDLKIAKMQNYSRQSRREKDWPPWIPPSPGIRSWETGYCYPATVFSEALPVVNIARNSNLIFQVFSIPGIKSKVLCKILNRLNLPGVNFYSHPYKLELPRTPQQSEAATFPACSRGTLLPRSSNIFDGVRMVVHNPDLFHPVTTSIFIISTIQKIGGVDLVWKHKGTRENFFDKLYGTNQVRLALQAGEPPKEIIRSWQRPLAKFNSVRRRFLLYADKL